MTYLYGKSFFSEECMETPLSNLWLVAILPIVSIVCLGLNFFIRARGGRSVVMNLKAFGIELNISSVSTDKDNVSSLVEVENTRTQQIQEQSNEQNAA